MIQSNKFKMKNEFIQSASDLAECKSYCEHGGICKLEKNDKDKHKS